MGLDLMFSSFSFYAILTSSYMERRYISMIKQKHVDAAREVRLWFKEVIIPAGVIVALFKDGDKLKEKAGKIKDHAKQKIGFTV